MIRAGAFHWKYSTSVNTCPPQACFKWKSLHIFPEQSDEEIPLRGGRTGPWEKVFPFQQKSFGSTQSLPCHPTALWAPLGPLAALCCNCHSISGKRGPKWETLWTADRPWLLMGWLWRKPNQGTCSFACLLPSPSLPTHAPSQWNVSLFPSLNFTRQQKN